MQTLLLHKRVYSRFKGRWMGGKFIVTNLVLEALAVVVSFHGLWGGKERVGRSFQIQN